MNKSIFTILLLSVVLTAGSAFTFGDKSNPHSTRSIKINYDSLFNEAIPIDNSDAGKKVISECINAYGGIKHLENLNSFHLSYEKKSYMVNTTINVDRYFQSGRKYKIINDTDNKMKTRILNNNQSWLESQDTVIIFPSGKHKAELFSYLTLSMPLALTHEPFSEVRYGKRTDKPYDYLYLKKNDSLMIITAIDPEDHFIKQVEGIIYQDSSSIVFINIFSHYNKHDGYYFPDSLVNISMGLEIAKSRLLKVEINPIITETFFNPKKNEVLK